MTTTNLTVTAQDNDLLVYAPDAHVEYEGHGIHQLLLDEGHRVVAGPVSPVQGREGYFTQHIGSDAGVFIAEGPYSDTEAQYDVDNDAPYYALPDLADDGDARAAGIARAAEDYRAAIVTALEHVG